MRDPKAIRKAIMTAKSIAAMVDPHFASVPLPDIGQPVPDMEMPPAPQQFATGGGVDDHVVNNPMSVFPKPQRMFDEDMPGGAYLSMPDKQDVTGHKAAQASIGIGEGGKPYFHASRDEVDETGTPGKGSALVKTNLFKQKAGWRLRATKAPAPSSPSSIAATTTMCWTRTSPTALSLAATPTRRLSRACVPPPVATSNWARR